MFSAMVSIGLAASWSVAARGTIMAGLGAGELPPWRCVHHTKICDENNGLLTLYHEREEARRARPSLRTVFLTADEDSSNKNCS